MNTPLERQRAAAALATKGKSPDRVMDTKDRMDLTYAPDAKKARFVVTSMASQSLPLVCLEIIKVTGEQKAKHELQEAFENFAVANRDYFKEEQRGAGDQLIGWMGGVNGLGIALPSDAPVHKLRLKEAWDAMVQKVNEATKVGINKKHKHLPIVLVADLESDKLILPTSSDGWN